MIVITGASRGIGKYLYDYYKASDVDEEIFGTSNAERSNDLNISQLAIENNEQVEAWSKSLANLNPSKITLINCVGIDISSIAHKSCVNDWQRVVQINLIGTFNVIRAFLPYMRSIEHGRIVNFSSIVAEKGVPGTSSYAASKSGLWGLSKAIAAENASKNITINSINLGYSDIGMGIDKISDEYRAAILKTIPANRFCQPQEILDTVQFLTEVGYINGASISLNGAAT